MTELVASGLKREAQVLEIASKLAMIPEIAGRQHHELRRRATRAGLDSRGHGGARARTRAERASDVRRPGSQDDRQDRSSRSGRSRCTTSSRSAATGRRRRCGRPSSTSTRCSWPRTSPRLRARTGTPFFISCAVSPFKYQREDLLYQYLKLEKKIAAGADMAITQVGWDATKFVELKKYLDERGIKTPVLGNVYVLSRRAAERMNTGNPPGCWASDELVAVLRKESEAADGGLQARLERAAQIGGGPQRASATPAPTSAAHTTRSTSRGSSAAPRSSRRSGRSSSRSCSSARRTASICTSATRSRSRRARSCRR